MPPIGTSGYEAVAERLLRAPLDFDAVHGPYLHLFPEPPSRILDVGAGPGHDSAVLAARGHHVVAVEPLRALREGARSLYPEGIDWRDGALPELDGIEPAFDLILVSGVWAHVEPSHRAAALERLAALLAPGGHLVLTLRHGPAAPGRVVFPIDPAHTVHLAGRCGLEPVFEHRRSSLLAQNRALGVSWTLLVLRTSSDGT